MNRFAIAALVTAAVASVSLAQTFSPFIIRNSGGGNPPTIQNNNAYVPNATEFIISAGSMKAGWGTDALSGLTLGGVTQMSITRHDNAGRFTAGSGPAVAPYFNIWITDGINYAVVANEPSNPSFNAFRTPAVGGGFTYSFSMADIGNEPARIYETVNGGTNNTWVHAALGMTGQTLTFNNLMNMVIGAPSASYIAGGNGIGGGAPRELGTNAAVSFNWIFGDTLSNYVSGAEGYVVSNPIALPTPGAAALLGVAGLAATRRRR